MNCTYCGYFNESQVPGCGRCGSALGEPHCEECDREVAWGVVICDRCTRLTRSADKTPCPSCATSNLVSAEYCTSCGTPMAVITRVMTMSRAREREPLETWRVYGIETRVVGRERELERLSGHFRQVVDTGSLRVVSVVGPTGLGKSRLLAEFQTRLNESFAAQVLHAASRDDSGGPYSMFARLLRERFYIGDKEHPESARRKLMEAVRSIVDGKDAERLAHLVGQLVDLTFEESPHVPTVRDSEGAHELDRRSYEALADVLRADAASDPLVLMLEDLQYATARSLRLVEFLVQHLSGSPVLMLVSWNPEEVMIDRGIYDLDVADELELSPLSDAEVESFVRDTLRKAKEIPPGLVAKITEAAHGNPLSVEEMLRILISQGTIDTRRSDWRIDPVKLARAELPSTVEATVKARLATLTEDERVVLGMASVAGTVFWPEAVRAMNRLRKETRGDAPAYWSDSDHDARCDELLESLERKDMIRRSDDSSLGGVEEMYFKHRIERSAVYGAMQAQEKQRYHRLLAQWLESRPKPHHEKLVGTIATHFDLGRCLDHAARRYIEAARMARDRYAIEKAVDLLVKGLSYLSDADMRLKMDAFADLGALYDLRGEYDQALAHYREMLRHSWLLLDRGAAGAASHRIGRAYISLGEYDLANDHLERALYLFREQEDERGIASTMDEVGKIHWMRGDYGEAEAFYSAALHLRRELGDERSIALSLHHMGSLALNRGEITAAARYFRESLELRRKVGDQQGVVESFNNLGILFLDRGETSHAVSLLQEALKLARKIGYRSALCYILNNLGEAALRAGEVVEAKSHLEEAMKVADDANERRALFDILRNLGKVALRESDREEALGFTNDAIQIATQLDSQLMLGLGMESLAELHAHFVFDDEYRDESVALADECYRDAISLLREVGDEGELGKALSSYGRFLIERGESDDGKDQLQQARAIFEKLQMHEMFSDADRVIGSL